MIMGQPIFYGPNVETVIAAQQAVLGPMPEHMVAESNIASMYFTREGSLYTVDPPGQVAGTYNVRPLASSLSAVLEIANLDEAAGLVDLLSALLCLDPSQRPHAANALHHPWILSMSEGQVASGPEAMAYAHRVTSSLSQYYSPSSSRATSHDPSLNSSPAGSRDASPMRTKDEALAAPQIPRPTMSKSSSKEGSGARRKHVFDGPGVPEDFRNSVQSESSRSHEWRQKLVRILAGSARDKSGKVSPALSPSEMEWQPPANPPRSAPNSFSRSSPSAERGGGGATSSSSGRSSPAAPSAALPTNAPHRPKMRL